MPKQTILIGNIEVIPSETPDPENPGKTIELKQLIITLENETLVYSMDSSLASKIGHRLKKGNKALQLELDEESRRLAARQKLQGANGGELDIREQKAVEDVLRGVHTKDDPPPK